MVPQDFSPVSSETGKLTFGHMPTNLVGKCVRLVFANLGRTEFMSTNILVAEGLAIKKH